MGFRRSISLALPGVVLALTVLSLAGCDDPPSETHYSVFAGKVVACHADTGELRVRMLRAGPEGSSEETIYCVVTRESEIYVNDKLSTMNEIQLGDEIELIGHRDPDPQTRRFVVSFAYLDHRLPAPAPPVFAPAPATQDSAVLEATVDTPEKSQGTTVENSTNKE